MNRSNIIAFGALIASLLCSSHALFSAEQPNRGNNTITIANLSALSVCINYYTKKNNDESRPQMHPISIQLAPGNQKEFLMEKLVNERSSFSLYSEQLVIDCTKELTQTSVNSVNDTEYITITNTEKALFITRGNRKTKAPELILGQFALKS